MSTSKKPFGGSLGDLFGSLFDTQPEPPKGEAVSAVAYAAGPSIEDVKREQREKLHTRATAYLQHCWQELILDGDGVHVFRLQGRIDAYAQIGILTSAEADGWRARIRTCPGHEEMGSLSWCSYCGAVAREEE